MRLAGPIKAELFRKVGRWWMSTGISCDRNKELANDSLVGGAATLFLPGLDVSWWQTERTTAQRSYLCSQWSSAGAPLKPQSVTAFSMTPRIVPHLNLARKMWWWKQLKIVEMSRFVEPQFKSYEENQEFSSGLNMFSNDGQVLSVSKNKQLGLFFSTQMDSIHIIFTELLTHAS